MSGRETIGFCRIDPAQIRRASFLDGREPVGVPGPSATVPELAAALPRRTTPVPTMLHVSFCGSTLLARLVDRPGETLVYREPAIQIALADRAAAGVATDSALTVVDALLARPVGGERVVVKPTNWVNTLLPAWAAAGAIRPVFVTMAPARFLAAVFRGGRDRIAFTLRTVPHFATVLPATLPLIDTAIHAGEDPLDRAARLTLVALHQQLALFGDARATLGIDQRHMMDEAEIREDPVAAARRAAALLGLAEPVAATTTGHAKDPQARFDPLAEKEADQAVAKEHGARFAAALDWARANGIAA